MRKIKKGEKEYLELPDDLKGKKLTIVRLSDGLYVVGTDSSIKGLIHRQVRYLMERHRPKKERRVIKRAEKPSDSGYWIFDSEAEAARFSQLHASEFQSGRIKGIRGFDGKFYAIRTWLYTRYLPRILDVLKTTPSTSKELSSALSIDEKLVKVILELAREEGLVIERSGGVYEYAG